MAAEVALFVTCLVDQLAPEAGVAAVRLLEAAGCRVAFPQAQSCCGQPALNTGATSYVTRPGTPLVRGGIRTVPAYPRTRTYTVPIR